MEAQVHILDSVVANQIAAGEVVERPASVVKELVENALDAGATEIAVIIDNGGISRIEVIDNGSGMTRENALVAIKRFGTSKLMAAEDLEEISTLGFRGEALPSIASVSQFSLRTFPAKEAGTEIRLQGGDCQEVNNVSGEPGTRVEVKQLFFNTPARKRFLRSERTEASFIKNLLINISLANPELRMRLVSDSKTVLSVAPASSFRERADQLKLVKGDAIVVDTVADTLAGKVGVEAVLTAPVDSHSSSSKLRLIINRRPVRDSVILSAVRQAYGQFLKAGKYPEGVVHLHIPASEVDVNAHPQKTEVRFRNSPQVFATVMRAIKQSLEDKSLETRAVETGVLEPSSTRSNANQEQLANWQSLSARKQAPEPLAAEPEFVFTESPAVAEPQASQPEPPRALRVLSQMRFVGQVFQCYLLLEGSDSMAVVDMHAAHERIRYCQLREELASGGVRAQALLIPETLELPVEQIEQFEKFKEPLAELGFDCERFGETSLAVRSVPAVLSELSPCALLEDLLSMPEWMDWKEVVAGKQHEVISRLACHSSIRSGRELEKQEVYQLLHDLEQAETSAYCPHGRPVVREFSEYELETMFGRS